MRNGATTPPSVEMIIPIEKAEARRGVGKSSPIQTNMTKKFEI